MEIKNLKEKVVKGIILAVGTLGSMAIAACVKTKPEALDESDKAEDAMIFEEDPAEEEVTDSE